MPTLKTTADLLARQRGAQAALEAFVKDEAPEAVRKQVRQKTHVADIAVECEFRWPGLAATVLDLVVSGDGVNAARIVREKLEALYTDDELIFQDEPRESEIRAALLARGPAKGREGTDHLVNCASEAARNANSPGGRKLIYQVRHQLRAAGREVPMNAPRS